MADILRNIDRLVGHAEEIFNELLRERSEMSAEIGRLREEFSARDEEAVRLLQERTRELEEARIEIERLGQERQRAVLMVHDLNDTLITLARNK